MSRQVAAQSAKSAPAIIGGILQRSCACGQHTGGGECEECRKKKGHLQRKEATGKPVNVPPIVYDVLRTPGRPLDTATRSVMEPRFGRDFSRVHVHTDAQAAESARTVDALAYTVGQHVVFGAGRFKPESTSGRRLLAHELVHVVQQEKAGSEAAFPLRVPLEIGSSHDAFEQEAEALAGDILSGAEPRRISAFRIQRQPSEAESPDAKEPPPAGELTTEMRRQIAVQLRNAMEGLGTDEESIYAALSGRTPRQIEEIRQTYEEMYKGRVLAEDLQDELTTGEIKKLATLAPTAVPTKETEPSATGQGADVVAAQIRAAVDYWLGTDEDAIFSALTGRPASQLEEIKAAYKRLPGGRDLEADLRDELSGVDLQRALILLKNGGLELEDQIWVATSGMGTDENLLFAALETLKGDSAKINAVIDAYRDKGYGDLLEDVRGDLSGQELNRAMELLHGATTSTKDCSSDERSSGLEAISIAASAARNGATMLSGALAKGELSGRVKRALDANFNPGEAKGSVTMSQVQGIIGVLIAARTELLSRNQVTCSTPSPLPCGSGDKCAAEPDCKLPNDTGQAKKFVVAWTCGPPGSVVRLCKAFFVCGFDQATTMLHEFVHHSGIDDKAYKGTDGYKKLQPLGDHSAADSLDNADSYAQLAKDLS